MRIIYFLIWACLLGTLVSCGKASSLRVGREVVEVTPQATPYFSPAPTPTPGTGTFNWPLPSVSPVPSGSPDPILPIPPPGGVACSLTKLAPVTQLGQPIPFRLNAAGNVTSASINGLPVVPGQPIPVVPLFDGTYLANGQVFGPGGSANCQLIVIVPRCTLRLLEATITRVRVELTAMGPVAQTFVNNVSRTLDGAGRDTYSFDPVEPGTVQGKVVSPAGDEGHCEVEYDLPVTTTAGAVTTWYFTAGYNPPTPEGFLMGGGVRSTYGNWSAIPGTSSIPIHTGVRAQRANDCGAGEIVVALGPSNIGQPWEQNICAALIEGLETYDSRTLYSPWSREQYTQCASGEVVTGIAFESGKDYGEWGGRLRVTCAKVRWED